MTVFSKMILTKTYNHGVKKFFKKSLPLLKHTDPGDTNYLVDSLVSVVWYHEGSPTAGRCVFHLETAGFSCPKRPRRKDLGSFPLSHS